MHLNITESPGNKTILEYQSKLDKKIDNLPIIENDTNNIIDYKTEIEEFRYYNYDEKYRPLVLLAGGLLLLEVLLRMTVFRSFV